MKKPRSYKIPTKQRLANIALYHLSRFSTTEAGLRRVLTNRLIRAAFRDADFSADQDKQKQLRLDIETIIDQHRKLGSLNDAAYAESKARGLRRAGGSKRAIAQKLKIKGVSSDDIAKAFAVEGEDNSEGDDGDDTAELKAAHILARKKKLGPYAKVSPPENTIDATKLRNRQIAAMARAGFSLSIIRQVLGGDVSEKEQE